MSDALFKFVGQLDIAWHAGDGVRSLRPSLSSHLKSPLLQTRPPFHAQPQTSPRPLCARIPLTSPWAPLLTELDGRLSWEGRKWLVKEEELSKMKRRKKHLVYQFTANLTRLPAILHWHVRFPLFLPLFHSFLVRLVKVYDRRDITRKHTPINYCPTPKSVKNCHEGKTSTGEECYGLLVNIAAMIGDWSTDQWSCSRLDIRARSCSNVYYIISACNWDTF